MKRFASIGAVLALLFGGASVTYAQVSASTTKANTISIQSDFAKDLEEGKLATAHDEEAKKNQIDARDSEQLGVDEEGQSQNDQQGISEQDLTESESDLSHEGDQGGTSSASQDGEQGSGGAMVPVHAPSPEATSSEQDNGNNQ